MVDHFLRTACVIGAAALLAGCVSAGPPAPRPTDGNAGSMYAWCVGEAQRRSPSLPGTIRGQAYVNEYVKACMLQNGAVPVVVIN